MSERTLEQGTLPAVMARGIVESAVRLGASRAELLPAGVGLEALPPEAPVPLGLVLELWETAMRRLRRPGLPIHFAQDFRLEQYPLFGFAVMTAPSAREALLRSQRFSGLITRSATWELVERQGEAEVRWHREGPRTLGHRVSNESALAEVLHGIRQALGREVRATVVRFRHPAPLDTSVHDAFFGGPIRWSADRDALSFPGAVLDETPRFANLALASHFEHEAVARLEALSAEDSLTARVRGGVLGLLGDGEPSLGAVARRLALGERTLRRALRAEGTSFRALVDEARRARAEQLLADRAVSLAEVAFALGFSEHAAFTRAYRRWTGRPPREGRPPPGGG